MKRLPQSLEDEALVQLRTPWLGLLAIVLAVGLAPALAGWLFWLGVGIRLPPAPP